MKESIGAALSQRLPDNPFLVLSVPRSGSHWLTDTLRVHPRIAYHERYLIHPALGLSGNRYARDLSIADESGIRIQNNPKSWAYMARLEPKLSLGQTILLWARKQYFIENFHPQMFGFDSDTFTKKFASLCEKKNVRIAYRVRKPEDCIRSFLDYKTRSPSWGRTVTDGRVVQHYRKSFESLAAIAEKFPGPVLDYDAMQNDYIGSIRSVFAHLWPQRSKWEQAIDDNIIEQAHLLTARELRKQVSSVFFSRETDFEPLRYSKYWNILEQHTRELEQCKMIYAQLTAIPR